jgi:hypothetical protein
MGAVDGTEEREVEMFLSRGSRCFLPATGVALLLLCIPAGLLSQDGLKFNVPYLCSDGSTYVVHHCDVGPKGEFCFYQRDNNSERFNRRSDVANQMNHCQLKGSASGAPSQAAQQANTGLLLDTPYDCGSGLVMTVLQCQRQGGQDTCLILTQMNGKMIGQLPKPRSETEEHFKACKAGTPFNPPYLAEFPNPYRVVEGMLVGKPHDNVVRAIGAFYQLAEIITVLATQRGGGLTPDEKKFLDDYSRVQGKMADAAAKQFPGEQFDPARNPYRFARKDPRFGFEGIPVWTTFLSPRLQLQFEDFVGGNDQQYLSEVDRQRRVGMQKLQAEVASQTADLQEQQGPKDAGAVAVRKCLNSGRSDLECLGEGMKIGVADLTGSRDLLLAKGPAGLRLTGLYTTGSNFALRFQQDTVVVGCGSLDPAPTPYTVERTASGIVVHVAISPKPLVLPYKLDGKMIGPGLIDVNGLVPARGGGGGTSTTYQMQTETTTTSRQIDAADVQNYNADQVNQNGMEYSVNEQHTSTNWTPMTTHHVVPMVPKTERCNVATLSPAGANISISGTLTQLMGTNAGKSSNAAPGLRLNGTYALPGGLNIEFRDDSATLGCGNALSSEGYAVEPEGGRLVVKFQHKEGPLALILEPNGTLTGSGMVDVAGRKIYKGANGEIEYTPVSARCSLGTLTATK